MAKRATTTKQSAAKRTRTAKNSSAAARTTTRNRRVAATKKAQTAAASKAGVNVYSLRSWHILSLGVFGLLAVLAALFINDTSYSVTLNYLTGDAITNVLLPATRHFMDLEVRWLVVAALAISTVLPILYLTRYERRYQDALKNKAVPWRWIDLAVTGALMVGTAALLSGLQDVNTLKLVGLSTAVIAAFWWLAERQNLNTTRTLWGSYLAGVAVKIVLFVIFALTAVATPVYGFVRASWFVYALYAAIGLGLFLYEINHFRQLRGQEYVKTERNYLLINLLTKSAFALILTLAFMR